MSTRQRFMCIISLLFVASLFIGNAAANETKIEDLISKMTLDEKVDMLGGTGFATKPLERLGIPEIKMADGPAGVRWGETSSIPAPICLAATWNPNLAEQIGALLGRETKAKERNMLLAPCVNIVRVPHGGRNFESFGEDPFLTSRIAVSYINGVQSENVIACVKHFACNNQERNRTTVNAKVDERAFREIYLPAFKAAVQEAKVWSVMTAYNRLNGHYCTANDYLQNQVLKKECGFPGFIVSDWGAVHSSVKTANTGLDLEMPTGEFWNESLVDSVKTGLIAEATIDDKIRRMLRAMFAIGLFDEKYVEDKGAANTTAHRELCLKAAREGIVLLKNVDNALPVKTDRVTSIAVIGSNAAKNQYGGGGSSRVTPYYTISALDGLKKSADKKVSIKYAKGYALEGDINPIESAYLKTKDGQPGLLGEYYQNMDFSGQPVLARVDKEVNFNWKQESPDVSMKNDNFSVRWTGQLIPDKSGEREIGLSSDDGVRLYFNGELKIDDWHDYAVKYHGFKTRLQAGQSYDIEIEYYENGGDAVAQLGWLPPGTDLVTEAIQTAKNADVALIFVGMSEHFESEGFDRDSLRLPADQVELIKSISKVNDRVIVVMNAGAAVLMSDWLDDIEALVLAWYPGQEGGQAVADILLGQVNPSGKLPQSWPKTWEDCSAFSTYPDTDGIADYSDGIFVGYRHFDKNGIEPLFPFGYGLSYTTFEYGRPTLSQKSFSNDEIVTILVEITNTGSTAGSEIVQLYVRDVSSSVVRPLKELKGFQKVTLESGESKIVEFPLNVDALKFYDVGQKSWQAEAGEFEILIGSSSAAGSLQGLTLEYK